MIYLIFYYVWWFLYGWWSRLLFSQILFWCIRNANYKGLHQLLAFSASHVSVIVTQITGKSNVHWTACSSQQQQNSLRVSCQKGPTRHAYAWQIGPFWQDNLEFRRLYCSVLLALFNGIHPQRASNAENILMLCVITFCLTSWYTSDGQVEHFSDICA